MKLSTLLLSSAAIIVAGSAYAADLPAKKGAPAAKAMAGCPAFGAGFWQIPGSDTCLKISGVVRYTGTMQAAPSVGSGKSAWSNSGSGGFSLDARSNTDAGTLRSVYDNWNSYYYVQVAGFTAGAYDSLTDKGIGGNKGNFSGQTDTGISYSTSMGASTISVSVHDAKTNYSSSDSATAAGRPDIAVGFDTTAGAVSLSLAAVSHDAGGKDGLAGIGTASVAMGGAKVSLYGAAGQGTTAYVLGTNTLVSGGPLSTAGIDDLSGGVLSNASNVGAAVSFALAGGTVSAFGSAANVTDDGGNYFKESTLGVNYAYTGIKGLTVRPEFYNTTQNLSGTSTTGQFITLRIQRDF
jgi:Porin subfamily